MKIDKLKDRIHEHEANTKMSKAYLEGKSITQLGDFAATAITQLAKAAFEDNEDAFKNLAALGRVLDDILPILAIKHLLSDTEPDCDDDCEHCPVTERQIPDAGCQH